jgi:cell division protein FtsN
MSNLRLVTLFAVPLLALAACSRERSDWRSAQAADTTESYEQFISEYPESELVASARERVAQLTEEKDWRTAASVDSLAAYQQFVAQHPAGKWTREAQLRIESFANAGPAAAGSAVPVPDAAAPAAAEGPAAPAVVSSGYGVQLGAFSSAERANAEWTRLRSETGGTLEGLSPRVVVGEASGRTIYRLQAEVHDEAQARAICGGLKVAKKACVPVLPH